MKYFSGYKIREDEMGRACSMYQSEEKYIMVLIRKPKARYP
jgi:hypothetical protein